MNILEIPKSLIDIITTLNCHEFAIGETIPCDEAADLVMELNDYTLYLYDSESLPEEEITGNLTVSDLLDLVLEVIPILDELSEDGVDRLKLSYQYRKVYNEIIDCIFSEKFIDELTIEELEHLNFVPITDGYVLPVCFRHVYDDNLIVYRRYTDTELRFSDVGYNEHDGILFDYYYKPNKK